MSEMEKSAGNVFEDLGIEDFDEMLLKAKQASTIMELMESKGLTRMQAAETIGLPQSKLSRLLNGRFRSVGVSKMLKAINRLGRDVQIVIGPDRHIAGQTTPGRVEAIRH
ncbi:MAG: helix-turn-helix domain-containing protein [Deltaproteobacteria bacterium]|jgi:predicted XRE-type DNA-binding protein|nr:helix-turn-helix domain-containing protein [Deltaproteobacteria bacterium]